MSDAITSRDEALTRGREAVGRRAWKDAHANLLAAHGRAPLPARDLELLAMAAHLLGLDVDTIDHLTGAHQRYLEQGDRESAARCAYWLGFALMHRGASAPASGWLARANRLLDDHEVDCVVRGYLLIPVAIHTTYRDPAEGYAIFGQAAEIADRFDDRDLSALARQGRGRALIRLGKAVEGLRLLDEAMVAVMAGDVSPLVAGDVYCSVLEACDETFDLRRAREWTTSLAHWCASQPDLVPYRGTCAIYRAEILQLQGEWPDAVTEIEHACGRLAATLSTPATGAAFYRRGELHRLRGEFARAEAAYRQASQFGATAQPGLALLRLAQGQPEGALASIRQSLNEVREPRLRARLLGAAVEVSLEAGDVASARQVAGELAEVAAAFEAPILTAASAHATGAVELAEGDPHAALGHLQRARRIWRELDTPYEEAKTRLLIATASEQIGDRETHDLELDAARATFVRLGATPDVGRLPVPAAMATPRDVSGLSDRELQVLRLVATGRTNRAIGDQLFISEKTVARHVSNIFNKLGLSSRAAATAYAYEHRLI